MIARIFFDIDETLIHTSTHDPKQNHVKFNLEDDPCTYHTIIRPCSHALIEFARELVGKENVFILTTSTEDYANKVNELAGWGFDPANIFPREMIQKHSYKTSMMYGGGGSATLAHTYANRNNVLIDNLPPRYNDAKMDLIGITDENYLKIRDYYGVDFPEDDFEETVKNFLKEKHESNTNSHTVSDSDS